MSQLITFPKVSHLITIDKLPEFLSFIYNGIPGFLDDICYQAYRTCQFEGGFNAFIEVLLGKSIEIQVPGSDGIVVQLNKNHIPGSNLTVIPLKFSFYWGIEKYITNIGLLLNAGSPVFFYDLGILVGKVSESELLSECVSKFVFGASPLTEFAIVANTYGAAVSLPLNNNPEIAQSDILLAIRNNASKSLSAIIYQEYIEEPGDDELTEYNINTLLAKFFGRGVAVDKLNALLIPEVTASAELSASVIFPRKYLMPMKQDSNGDWIPDEDENIKTSLDITAGSLFIDTAKKSWGFRDEIAVNLSPVKSRIGSTPFTITIQNASVRFVKKYDTAQKVVVAVGSAEIGLPSAMKQTNVGSGPSIEGVNIIIDSELGLSGTFRLNGSGTLQYTFANDLTLELVSFDLTFENGAIVNSNVLGTITIPSFENNPLNVELTFDDGFTVKVYTTGVGIPIINNENVLTTLNGLELGKSETAWKLGFVAHFLMKRELPLLSKIFPKQIDINHFLYKTDGTLEYDFHIEWLSGAVINGDHDNGVSAVFPIKLSIGKDLFKIDSLLLKVTKRPDNSGLEAQVMLQGVGFDFGPVSGGIEGFGIEVGLERGTTGNNLGPFKYDLGLVGPKGVDLTINAGPVNGSGYLYIGDHEYYGMFTLSIGKFGIGIIGILTTQLPTGNAGYSLLMIVAVEFGTIPIGFGFTLNGVGGLLGLHRTMNPDVLRTGIRDNTLDYILFPQDVNKGNVSSYISNIGQAFPVKEGQFMVGPMAKIGWGTPNILTIDLGIILEFPEPVRLAILGLLKAEWKAGEKSILKLQVNFLGIIDFTARYLSFDASIFDSKILTFPLMGDMALRLYWGDKPNFLISVGGFHPRYTPPPLNLPELRRLSLVLADDKNLKVGIETYFAITSNSVQFGAKVMAEAKMWDGKINVLGALWFDILFKFNPFYFAADMGAQFAVRWKQKEILSIFINLMLEGPNPWRAQGKGTFKVIGIGVTVSFDKTFGKAIAATVDPAELDAQFAAQVAHPDNWEALLPQRSHQQVLWKEAAANEGLIVDTGGQLRFSQKLLPLNIELSKFGTAPIKDTKRFELTSYELTQSGQTESFTTLSPAKDLFARGEYFNMTDDDKLSKDPYESFESGVFIGSDKLSSDYAVHRKVVYEDIVIDTGFREVKTNKWSLSPALMQVHLLDSYVSKSVLSDFTTVGNSDAPPRVAAVNAIEERFVVVDRDSLAVMTDPFMSSAAAEHFLATQMQSSNSNTASNWIVANEFELV